MIYCESILPLAEVEGWVKAISFLIFIVFWVISQVFGKDGENPQRPARRAPNQPGPAGEGGPVGEDRIREELQDFLRQAAQRQPAHREELAAAEEVVEAEIIESGRLQPTVSTIASRESLHSTAVDELTDRSHPLGEEVALADDKVEARLREVFGHDLGRDPDQFHNEPIGDPTDTGEESERVVVPSLAKEIRDLFREPDSVRKAIVLHEVFRRPEDRW